MALPDYTTQDAATYKANIDSEVAKGAELNTKIINIGDWDMSAATGSASINLAHGLDRTKIRSMTAIIRIDDNSQYFDFPASSNTATSNEYIAATVTNVTLYRGTAGIFDSTNFNTGTSYNRGWIIIQYTD